MIGGGWAKKIGEDIFPQTDLTGREEEEEEEEEEKRKKYNKKRSVNLTSLPHQMSASLLKVIIYDSVR